MMTRRVFGLALWIMGVGLGSALAQTPDVVYHNAKVVTVNAQFEIAQAVAVAGGKIVAVGSNDQVKALAGAQTTLVDLAGKPLLPGFYDNHIHLGGPLQPWKHGGMITAIPQCRAPRARSRMATRHPRHGRCRRCHDGQRNRENPSSVPARQPPSLSSPRVGAAARGHDQEDGRVADHGCEPARLPARARRTDNARAVLDELEAHRREHYVSWFGTALIHDALGEKELALAALRRAYSDHAVEFGQMPQYPPFKVIASEAGFQAVMRLVGR